MWLDFLKDNLNTQIPINNKAPKGEYIVIAKFIVTKKGMVEDITTETNFGYGMEKEVARILPLRYWHSAKKKGVPVNSYKRVSIKFTIN